ncbi:histone-lysine N-methyltransferase SETMAR [Trichonephila clavipes]|nr:histone-lysine N-methyltransferase SETMAR [Trichonephila clavipes]
MRNSKKSTVSPVYDYGACKKSLECLFGLGALGKTKIPCTVLHPKYVQFWFRRFRSGIFDVKDALHTGRPVVENVDKITEIIEVDRYVGSRSIAQELKIDHKTVSNHLRKVGFKKKLDVWVPHQLTP